MKKAFSIAVVTGLLFAGCSSSNKQEGNTTSEAQDSKAHYAAAVAKAKSENKLVLVDVYTDWCGWCKRMDKDVYTDAKVQAELNKYFAFAKLNAESPNKQVFQGSEVSEQTIAGNLKVSGYPTTIFMTSDEQVIQTLPGYVKAPDFALALRYIGSQAYKSQDFESWKKTQS